MFNTEVVHDKGEGKVSMCYVCPEARDMFGLFEICVFKCFGQFCVCKLAG